MVRTRIDGPSAEAETPAQTSRTSSSSSAASSDRPSGRSAPAIWRSTSPERSSASRADRSIQTIPDWVRSNAKWWADGAISDNDFTSGIEFMIKQDIIKVPQIISEKEKSSFTLGKIPTWIKSNAKWWSEDLISDEDFVKGIEFLIKEEIIRI